MRKQTKLVAVLSAAALLALGASMTSFAAGWEKDEDGIWHYYDADDEMVTDEWKKDGGKWFYLDEDGDMLTNDWVDDDYYVGEDGAMLVNQWIKTYSDEDQDDPDEDGEHWYYFGSKGKKVADQDKKINGKTYYFDEDGKMKTGWQEENGEGYYLGDEDDGARTENQWLWLEKSGLIDDDDDELEGEKVLTCNDTDDDECDDEGWYWFQSSGKVYHDTGKKKINGKFYIFNEHGQMLYEWIDNDTNIKRGSNAQLDDTKRASGASAKKASIGQMLYYNVVEDGSRGNGWYELDGAKDVGTNNDTDWYYIDDGEVKYADSANDFATWDEDGLPVYIQRIKIDGKYFAFNEKGQMQDGLQYVADDGGFFYFDSNGYQKTGKVSNVECDDDDYNFYFTTNNGKNGQGYKGEKDNYLYFNGKRLEADDDYRLYFYEDEIYLVNTKGKIQKASGDGKDFDIENKGIAEDDVRVKTDKNGRVSEVKTSTKTWTREQLLAKMVEEVSASSSTTGTVTQYVTGAEKVMKDTIVSVPFISLYDDDVYTYGFKKTIKDGKDVYEENGEGWLEVNKTSSSTKIY